MRVLVAAVLLLFPMSATAQSAPPTTAARIAQRYLDAVATVISLDENRQPLALGSGFFIDQQGHLVTSAHVVEGAASVIVRSRSERRDAARVIRFDPRYDVVVLETGFHNTAAVPVSESQHVAVGEEVVVLSNPRGLEGSVSTGIVSALREIAGVQYLQITAPISPGSSGGPVFNANGRVIGIATETVSRGQNLNFALAADALSNLPAVDLRFKTVRTARVEEGDISRWKDLVRVTNVFESIDSSLGWLDGVTFSIQNDARVVVRDVVVLLAVRGPTGQVLDFKLKSFSDVIPPGLAKQVSLDSLYVKGYAEGYVEHLDREKYVDERLGPWPEQRKNEDYSEYLRRRYEYSRRREEMAKESPRGSVEFRILDFKTMTAETPVEQLLKSR
jgi:S1-C subfamily serine protease